MLSQFVTERTANSALRIVIVSSIAIAIPNAAIGESNEVRFAEQFGLHYLPMHVVVARKMVEECAASAGLGEIKVSMHRFSGGAAVNQALLSGNVDLVGGGIPPLLTLWDKTKGRLNVKAAVSIAAAPFKLNTNDPRIKTIKDYLNVDDHKIAVSSVKVSLQAMILQMAAEKTWGKGQAFKLDELTVSMNHPTAATALEVGGQAVKSHFATVPESWQQLRSKGKIHSVLNSYDVIGGPHATTVVFGAEKWRSDNPKLFKCVHSSFKKAVDWINANKTEAAKLFVEFNKSNLAVGDVESMISDPNEIQFTTQPERTMEFAKFLHSIGSISNLPASWKDYFWDENYNESGS